MFNKKIKLIFVFLLIYPNFIFAKSKDFNSEDLSRYFSGIVAFDNKDNSNALNFFNSSKILTNRHDAYLEKLVKALVLENKVAQAINILKLNKGKKNSDFFEAYILLALDGLKKNEFKITSKILSEVPEYLQSDRFNYIILETFKQYTYLFKEKKFLNNNQNFGNFSSINHTFQNCYLGDKKTSSLFSKLINSKEGDYSRYVYFYLTYLINNNEFDKAKNLVSDIDYINSTLLISQGKSWFENKEFKKFNKIFSCKNHNDVVGEFLFLVSNLYSSQDEFQKSNFYLSLSNYSNPRFIFNLSLVAENFFLNKDYKKAEVILKKFNKKQDFYYWYRIRKEAQIISKKKNQKEGLKYITSKFDKISNPNSRMIFDIANFYKNSKNYFQAIRYYSLIIDSLDENSELKSDLLYRRGGSYERIKDYKNADKDLLNSLRIKPNDAYVLNYLAYSWLERNYKIDEAIQMLEQAYELKSDDPYIIDSIGWGYYLIDDFVKAEKFLKRAVEMMPGDPIVNDHYGDILWKLDRKIQARYFWSMVLKMSDTEKEMIDKINIKLIKGLEKS
tara:strand:+ start:2997 stop:4673 length:1677 start_codon:yes stop_codon:yes gene_type:complete